MDYGTPDPKTAFATGHPNGAAYTMADFRAGRSCDVSALMRDGGAKALDPALLKFLVNYNRLAVFLQERFGGFPYNANIYHFYVPTNVGADFFNLDKRDVAAYIVRRESACLRFTNNRLDQKIVSVGEQKVEVP
jgi:hypothetical protein